MNTAEKSVFLIHRSSLKKKIKRIFSAFGPGLITGVSDDDSSGVLTYLQSGTVFGFKTLWTALLTLPLMYSIQEMSGRIGYVTDKGLVKVIKEHYSKYILYFISFISAFVITVNIAADLLASGVIFEKLLGFSRFIWIPAISILIIMLMVFFSYQKFARVLKWLSFAMIFYVVTVFYIKINWLMALKATFIPSFSFSKENILLITAIIGTTISPYLFFWQASEEVEERDDAKVRKSLKKFLVTRNELKILREDTFFGMIISNVVMWFIIAGASNLANYGVKEIATFDQAAAVLKPILGNFAFLAFGLGLIGVGFLAIPVLAGSVGYILSEIFDWQEGLNKKFREAKGFYLVIIIATVLGIAVNFFSKIDPIQLLVYTAVLYTIITPPLIFIIMKIANNKKIMKGKTSSPAINILGALTFLITAFLAVAYLFL